MPSRLYGGLCLILDIMLIISAIVIAVLIIADQLIKHWAVNELMPVGTMDFIKFRDAEIVSLTYVQNDGAAFSSFSGAKIFLIVLTSVMIVSLTVWAIRDKTKNPFMTLSISVIIAGGIGNLIDRIRLGYVVDYIEIKLFRFAIFNFADMCVVVGAACLLVYVIFIEKKVTDSNGKV